MKINFSKLATLENFASVALLAILLSFAFVSIQASNNAQTVGQLQNGIAETDTFLPKCCIIRDPDTGQCLKWRPGRCPIVAGGNNAANVPKGEEKQTIIFERKKRRLKAKPKP